MAVVPTTWNPADKDATVTLSGGDLTAAVAGTGGSVRSVFSATSGKYYCEITFPAGANQMVGVAHGDATIASWPGSDARGYAYDTTGGSVYNGGFTVASGGATPTTLGLLIDADTPELKLTLDGVDYGTAVAIASSDPLFVIFGFSGTVTANFGGSAFVHSVPSGYEAGFGADLNTTVSPGSVLAGSVGGPAAIAEADATVFPATLVVGSIGATTAVRGPNVVVSADTVTPVSFGVPVSQLGYPATASAGTTVVGSVGTPEALPYSHRQVQASSVTPVKISQPLAAFAPVVIGNTVLLAQSLSPVSVGAPRGYGQYTANPASVTAGAIGAPSAMTTTKPASVTAGSIGAPAIVVGVTASSVSPVAIGSPSAIVIAKPSSVTPWVVGSPSASASMIVMPGSVVAGSVSAAAVGMITVHPLPVFAIGRIGRPTVSRGLQC